MMHSKTEFLKTFLPEECEDISFVQIDLDITDLSIADVLRNLNTAYAPNTRTRNAIASGRKAVGILCKSETLEPLNGMFLIVTADWIGVEVVSKDYIVMSIPEGKIRTETDLKGLLDKIQGYLIHNFNNVIEDFTNFYVKYVYDKVMEEKDDDE